MNGKSTILSPPPPHPQSHSAPSSSTLSSQSNVWDPSNQIVQIWVLSSKLAKLMSCIKSVFACLPIENTFENRFWVCFDTSGRRRLQF